MARDTTTTTARGPRRAARPGRLAAVAILLGCQALPPGASSPTADGFYRDTGRGHRYPRPEAEILQAVEREDLPTLRRHG